MESSITASSSFPALLRQYRREHDLAPGSVGQLRCAAKLFSRWHRRAAGRWPTLGDLTHDAANDWIEWLARSRKPATANSKARSILTLWDWAADRGAIAAPRRRRIKRLVEGDRPPVAWSLQEVGAIRAACRAEQGWWEEGPAALYWEIAILMLWDTGARIGELCRAAPESIDLSRGTWTVPASERKGRRRAKTYRLHAETLALLARVLPAKRARLWPCPGHRRNIWPRYAAILRRAGLPAGRDRKFHCLRRTAESHAAAERGVAWAAEAVGHGEAVARRSYISPTIVPGPSLVDALPRIPEPPATGDLK